MAFQMKVAQLCPTLCDPMDYTVHGILQARILEWVAFPFSRGIFPTQGWNPGLLHCRQILYQLSHEGSPKNTGMGSLSLLQRIFLTQESNQGLLHCRRILYQLSYQGSPIQGPSKAQFKYHLFHNISLSSSLKFVFFLSILYFF